MKVVLAGSRNLFPTYSELELIIKNSNFKITEIVSGGAVGVDSIGELYAMENKIPTTKTKFHIQDWVWKALGKKAGPIRNEAMAKYADAAIIIHNGSRGSLNMKQQMEKLKKPIYEVIISD